MLSYLELSLWILIEVEVEREQISRSFKCWCCFSLSPSPHTIPVSVPVSLFLCPDPASHLLTQFSTAFPKKHISYLPNISVLGSHDENVMTWNSIKLSQNEIRNVRRSISRSPSISSLYSKIMDNTFLRTSSLFFISLYPRHVMLKQGTSYIKLKLKSNKAQW